MRETNPAHLNYAQPQPLSDGRQFRRQIAMAFGIIFVVVAGVAATICWHGYQREVMARPLVAASDANNLGTAVDAFGDDTGRYPTTLEGWNALVVEPRGVAHWKGPYLKRIPLDPWGRPYVYRNIAGGYRVLSVGPDGKEGTADDIAAPLAPPPPVTTQASPAGS